MARAPRFGSYLLLGRLARSDEGVAYRGYDADRSGREVLLVTTPATGPTSRWPERLEQLPAGLVVDSGATGERRWVVLPPDQDRVAVGLIGLAELPTRHPLARAWGWPHPYARTGRELAVRIVVTPGGGRWPWSGSSGSSGCCSPDVGGARYSPVAPSIQLPQQVGVAVVPGVLLDHVHQHPADVPRPPRRAPRQVRSRR